VSQSPPSIFISYSHADKDLARRLADALRQHGVKVWIDAGELKIGDSLIERIATAIAEIDFFLALVSESSRESNWCRKELALAVTGELGREGVKVLPVRVAGTKMPDSLADVFYLELDDSNSDDVAQKVVDAIPKHKAEQDERTMRTRRRKQAERTGQSAAAGSGTPIPADFEPIRIVGIVEEGIGKPRNDGTPGSALYRIPLRLSAEPSRVWAEHFVQTWDHPPQFTTMHRPGIASVFSDTVVLNGTTVEELERYHVETLRHVLAKVNADVAEHERNENARLARDAEAARQHEKSVSEVASRLKFD
jgi:hypothetical protein